LRSFHKLYTNISAMEQVQCHFVYTFLNINFKVKIFLSQVTVIKVYMSIYVYKICHF